MYFNILIIKIYQRVLKILRITRPINSIEGRFMEKMVSMGNFVVLRPSSKDMTCSHQKFVDDFIVMG